MASPVIVIIAVLAVFAAVVLGAGAPRTMSAQPAIQASNQTANTVGPIQPGGLTRAAASGPPPRRAADAR